ncbi:MAG: cytidylyltransferase domain-containing protein, partial [Cyclobacteriaceae bacterium]
MKIGAIILCRYSSTRLPGKILKSISGKPILQYILERLDESSTITQIVVATSNDPSDRPIVDFCEGNGVKCYTGSLENVSQRFLEAAISFDLDYAIRVNGDNLFVDAQIIDKMSKSLEKNRYDFISNVPKRTFPIGMSVEIVRTDFYRNQLVNFAASSDYEHVTQYLYNNPDLGNYHFV